MPVKVIGQNVYERELPGASPRAYVASPAMVASVRAWYEDPEIHVERPAQEQPDGWAILLRARDGDRDLFTLSHGGTDACVEARFRKVDGEYFDVDVQPLPPDRAHELLMDHDDVARSRGATVYNARHPKP